MGMLKAAVMASRASALRPSVRYLRERQHERERKDGKMRPIDWDV